MYIKNVPITSGLNIVKNQYWGTVQVSPSSDGFESGISLYRYVDKILTSAGDAWLIVANQATPGSFNIYSSVIGSALTIAPTGAITIPYSLTVSNLFINNVNIGTKFDSYYTKTHIDINYYDKYWLVNTFSNFYTQIEVDNFIDAKIDSTYVLEMMYNEDGHNYFIAVDSTTSTTDAQIILNNAQKTPLVKFDLNGSKFYYPLVANIFLLP